MKGSNSGFPTSLYQIRIKVFQLMILSLTLLTFLQKSLFFHLLKVWQPETMHIQWIIHFVIFKWLALIHLCSLLYRHSSFSH